jgi:hypothetical protein
VAQVVEHLPRKFKALNSIPSITKKEEEEEEREKKEKVSFL